MAAEVPGVAFPTVSLAVIVWLAMVLKVTVNRPTPRTSVALAGSFADVSEVVIWTVPT
jgi:hypothetical protein